MPLIYLLICCIQFIVEMEHWGKILWFGKSGIHNLVLVYLGNKCMFIQFVVFYIV